METVTEVPVRLKGRRKRATCPRPLWSADCTLCWMLPRTYGRRRYPPISDDGGSLASAILHPPSIGARNDPARLNCSRPHATVTAGLTIPRIVAYCIHTRKCTYVIPPAVYTRGSITGVSGIRRKHCTRWLIFSVAYYASICTVRICEITFSNVNK